MKKIILNERIKELRQLKGWSQVQLAEKVGVRQTAVSKWEANNVLPDYQTLIKLSEIFNETVGYLLGIED